MRLVRHARADAASTPWLLAAVAKIVNTYTRPGQRVLLLASPPDTARPPAPASTELRTRLARNDYDGLLDAARTVARLDRDVHTRTADPQTGSGPRTVHLVQDDGPEESPDRRPDPPVIATAPRPDRFDLIIAAAEPFALDGLRPTNWAGFLNPNGTLAVVTHCDRSTGRLIDPAGPLVRAAHHAGLSYFDRIALLHTRLPDPSSTGSRGCPDVPPQQTTAPARHIQAHAELFLFTRRTNLLNGNRGEETSDA
ncbi:hypothetical protein [Saccharothrix sp. NRRL B-16314]|uniref:hypothetical protein n=1 Tax=Saccharothrix sp. NRRL B-16314 TaxID=1463825 RepID=UPI0012DEE867|nr:hypothetical protein [Saccharothrix sp. NRRL B-16314]